MNKYEEFSDSSNAIIIIACFTFYYLYLKYIQLQLTMSRGFNNINCNPIQLIAGGIIDEENANKTFESCMEYATAEKTRKSIEKANNKYEKNMTNIIKDISNNNSDSNEKTLQKQKGLTTLVNTKVNNINDLMKRQRMLNKISSDTETPINTLIDTINTLTSSLNNSLSTLMNKN